MELEGFGSRQELRGIHHPPTKTDAVHMSAVTTSTDWQFTTEDARIKLKRLYPLTLLECVTSPNP